MKFKEIMALVGQLGIGVFLIFWAYHIVECIRRKDYGIFDKIFWFLLLLVPVIGLIMYRGIGNEFYKHKSGGPGGGQ